jgi:parallel beta-helix repeat protein
MIIASIFLSTLQCANLATANFKPAPLPVIRILSDGSISPSTSLIVRTGELYTLSSNSSSYVIDVECSNIKLDGAGFFIIGRSMADNGITLVNVSNVTILNFNIMNCNKNIFLNASLGNDIEGNNVAGGNFGIELYGSGNNLVSNNSITSSYCGLRIINSGNNTLRGNRILGEKDFVVTGSLIDHFLNDIDASNTIDGRTVCYWVNRQDAVVPQDQSYIALVNCKNITVQNQNIHNSQGILLAWTNYSTVTNCAVHYNFNGVQLISSTDDLIGDNLIWGNIGLDSEGGDGISLFDSHSIKIVNNVVSANWKGGITLSASSKNQIIGNNVTQNWKNGINLLANSDTNIIAQNRLYNQDSQSHAALFAQDSSYNIITANNVTDNVCYGMQFLGSQQNNVLYHNNFMNNAPFSLEYQRLQVSMPGIDDQHLTANRDFWDNGSEGNYWSDYTTRYPNATEKSNQGVGDTPFVINDNNIDRFPLLTPFPILTISTSSFIPSISPSETQKPEISPSPSSQADKQQTGFLGTNLPLEYSYAIVAVLIIIVVVAGLSLVYYKKLRK